MPNIVYVLTNPAMPNLIKIGMTNNDLNQRIAELSRATGVPLPFEIFYAAEVGDALMCEGLLHNVFIDKRINPRREFFTLAPEQAVSAIKLAEIKNITPQNDVVDSTEEQIALNDARKRRDKISLKNLDIPDGSTLHFIDDYSITCTVILINSRVLFYGEDLSLSDSAKKAYEKLNKFINYPLQGSAYWMFENETLVERRMRMERGE